MAAQVIPFRSRPIPIVPRANPVSGLLAHFPNVEYTAADYARAIRYNAPYLRAWLATLATGWLGLILVLAVGWPVKIEQRFGAGPARWPARALFLAIVFAWLTALALPAAAAGYFHQRDFGLTAMTPAAWLKLQTIATGMGLLFFLLKNLLIFCCIPLFRRAWWIAAALALWVLVGILPDCMPNRPADPVWRLTPLPNGAHRAALTDVLDRAGRRLELLVLDESRRSTTVNMFLYGHSAGPAIVITDTLLQRFSPAEVAVLAAHELGHARTRWSFLFLTSLATLLDLLLAFGLAAGLMRDAADHPARWLQLGVTAMLCAQVTAFIFTPADRALAQRDERAADRYALALTRDPVAFAALFVKGARVNLEQPDPGWLTYRLLRNTPTLLQRLQMAADFDPTS